MRTGQARLSAMMKTMLCTSLWGFVYSNGTNRPLVKAIGQLNLG
jgi:hypothetical protein